MVREKILNLHNFIRDQRRLEFIDIARQWFKTPYIYGGNSFAGIDCSGFICNVLRSIGQIGQKDDYTANGLWKKLSKPDNVFDQPEPGRIAFWFNKDNKAIHIAICTSYTMTIQAARGGDDIIDVETAIKNNAMIDYVPVDYRLDKESRFVDIFI